MSLTKTQTIIAIAAGVVVLVFALIFLGVIPGLQNQATNPTKIKAALNFWGIGDASGAYAEFFADFKKTYPSITVNYRQFSNPNAYQSTLLDALASGEGPDIFMIKNTDLPQNVNKIVPADPTQFSAVQLGQYFPQVVSRDFSYENGVYALPLSVDTLALIYNRDLFDQAAVPLPSSWKNWEDFISAIPKLTKKDPNGQITQSAAALGVSANVANAPDILYLLMLQNGTQMTNPQNENVAFTSDGGIGALDFLAQFSNPVSNTYTWNKSMLSSLDAFSQSKTAMIFGYAADLAGIRSRNSLLKFEVAPVPQPKNASLGVSYPSYWGYVVSKQSNYQGIAWSLVLDMATNEVLARNYAQNNQKPPALNSLIYQYQIDPTLGVFARQALTARSWAMLDSSFINQAVSDMIDSVAGGGQKPKDALGQTQNQINQYLNQKSAQ
jgi:multiple sugar transport system substrate-binding protein